MKTTPVKLFYLFVLFVCIWSCKKTDAPAASSGSSNTSGNFANNPTNETMDYSNCYGEIDFLKDTSIDLSSGAVGTNIVQAFFYPVPITDATKQAVDAGVVNINGTALEKYNGPNYYDPTLKLIRLGAFNLSASGSSSFQAVSFNYSDGNITFADTNLLPKAISGATGFQLVLPHAVNADSAQLTLSDNNNHMIRKKVLCSGLIGFTIKAEELVNFHPLYDSLLFLKMEFMKRRLVSVNKRDFLVYYNKAFSKYNVKLNR